MENQEFQYKLQAWATREMSPSEVQALQVETAQSSELMEEMLFSKKLVQTLQNRELFEVNDLVGSIIANQALQKQPARGRNLFAFLSAILLLGLVGSGVYVAGNQFNWWSIDSNLQSISNTFITPLENTIFVEDGNYVMQTLRSGMEAYDAKDYTTAVTRLQAYYDKTKDANGGLYLGITHLLLKDAQKAVTLLQPVSLQLDGPAREAANWYLALGYLQLNEEQNSIDILRDLSAGIFYKDKATQLLEQLKND